MCMLSIFTPGAEIVGEHLYNGARQNPDGYGWAVVTHKGYGGLLVGKSMSRWEAIDGFKEARKAHPGTYGMFHSRWGTGGVKTVANCHPFQVGKDRLTVLGHNGIFGGLQPAWNSGDTRSDTAVFAEEVMPTRFRRLDRAGVQSQLRKAIGTYNKVAILTANTKYLNDAYLFNEEAGNWVDDVWHSNGDYKGFSRRRYGGSYLVDVDDDGDGWTSYKSETGRTYHWRRSARRFECPVCFADMRETVDLATGECQLCGFCVSCETWIESCSCVSAFRPAQHGLGVVTTVTSTPLSWLPQRQERLALPPGSGSATRYGEGFDGEDDDDGTAVAVLGEPADGKDCEYHPSTGWCVSRACVYYHRLATYDDADRIDPADVIADFDDSVEGVVMGPSSLTVSP